MTADDQAAGSNGWPLGLQPLNVRLRLMEHIRLADAASFLLSTPSITSESSSDLDTESTGSFFPEKSTTLGSLIGIHSNSQIGESHGVIQQILEAGTSKKRSTRPQRSWCPLLGCAGSDSSQETMSPSLAHLLELERRAALSQRQEISEQLTDEDAISTAEPTFQGNTVFDDHRILPPNPSGAPLKLILEQSSPNSSYLSGDWSASVPAFNRGHGTLAQGGQHSGRFPMIWPSICRRLGITLLN